MVVFLSRCNRVPSSCAPVLAAILLLPFGLPAEAQIVLNEVLYDPSGPDSGGEFVELYNAGPDAVSLEGWRLDFANGAVPLQWQTRWTGRVGDVLAVGGYWLIADSGWAGEANPDAEVSLSLQNGPDAIRLLRADGSADRLGYGDLDEAGFYEGAPHAGATAGRSLARRPDGRDSDSNASDWVVLELPTPGASNFRETDGEVSGVRFQPPSLARPGEAVVVEFTLRNSGLVGWVSGQMTLEIDGLDVGLRADRPLLAPDSTSTLAFSWSPSGPGRFALKLCFDSASQNTIEPYYTAYQVGVESIYLNEIMSAPPGDSCEWLEIGNASGAAVDLGECFYRDEDGDWRALPEVTLAAGALCLVVQDSADFDRWWLGVVASGGGRGDCAPPLPLEGPGGWASLNNSAPDGRDFADCVRLADSAGVTVDHVFLEDDGVSVAGRSLERLHVSPAGSSKSNWRPATTACGCTPGCPNSIAEASSEGLGLALHPNPFRPGSDAGDSVLHIGFDLSEDCPAWRCEIYDLWGRQVRDLGGDRLGAGRRDVLWDGTEDSGQYAATGAYIVLIRTFDGTMSPCGGTRRLAVIGERPGR